MRYVKASATLARVANFLSIILYLLSLLRICQKIGRSAELVGEVAHREALEQALFAFAKGRGSSIMTITCINPETYEAATRDPEKYDLLRARMSGWSGFFVTMFPAHQAQYQRRPFETA
jgi:pyruvate-formate lyase